MRIILEKYNLWPTDCADINELYAHFMALHLPEEKVIQIANSLGLEKDVKELVELRKKSTLESYKREI